METDKHKEWLDKMGEWLAFDPIDPLRPPLPEYVPSFQNEWKTPMVVVLWPGFIFFCWNQKQYDEMTKYQKIGDYIGISIIILVPLITVIFFILIVNHFLHQQ